MTLPTDTTPKAPESQPEVTMTGTSGSPYPVTTTIFIDDKPHCFVDQRDYEKLLAEHEASLIRLREIEGRLREPTLEMVKAGGKAIEYDKDGDDAKFIARGAARCAWDAMSTLLLRGRP